MEINLTPMMKQYLEIKKSYQDAVLFFRLGDFYEMFNQDALEVSTLLNLTLTHRGKNPMCGIPYHAANNYIKRLLSLGKKIAICEQVGEIVDGKGIVERGVVRVITPGTVIEEAFLEQDVNNYVAAAALFGKELSFSYVDVSTGDFMSASFTTDAPAELLRREIFRIHCTELIIQDSLFLQNPKLANFFSSLEPFIVNRYPDWSFEKESAVSRLKAHFKTASLKGFGLEDDFNGLATCGVLLDYLQDNCRSSLMQLTNIKKYHEDRYLLMDESTLRNLEILRNLQDGSTFYSLFKVLNFTKTSGGARLLKEWLLNPLREIEAIQNRLKQVDFLYHKQMFLSSLREQLASIQDISRLATRIAMDKAHAKDLLALGYSLEGFVQIYQLLSAEAKELPFLTSIDESVVERVATIAQTILSTIVAEPSIVLSEGNMIQAGVSEKLDHCRYLKDNSEKILQDYLDLERKNSGISTLKVKYNRIIGYFLEVTKSNLDQVPAHFIRRQSLIGNERFTTEKLNELEVQLNSATDETFQLEKDLFIQLRDSLKVYIEDFHQVAFFLSQLDCFQSLAWCATVRNYCCPQISTGKKLEIVEGRHPVVEACLKDQQFIPNSLTLQTEDCSFILLTGPNMAGKSTLLRQVALIALMAQAGSFVPASKATIGIIDRIFCRVGASDNLARGESTFLVEMNETANILRNATDESLVVMDEVGRGTSTNEGLSIAWAICEVLLEKKIRTLFATHFHELTLLKHPLLKNKSMRVLKEKDKITFLKELVDGQAESSYALYVAKLAGVPTAVLNRASQVLKSIEDQAIKGSMEIPAMKAQPSLFSPAEEFLQIVSNYDVYRHSPLEVMQEVVKWQKEIHDHLN